MQPSIKTDVIIPSYNNDAMLNVAKTSIVNNTKKELRVFKSDTTVNKGWMGACNEGIQKSLADDGSKYILLSNDDIIVSPVSDWGIMVDIMESFPKIGALGPLTNNACGWSRLSEYHADKQMWQFYAVPYISHFFVLLRKEAVKKVGLLDEQLPGGDDLDYSFRMNDAGYMTCVTPKVFVWHHYGQTGKRIYGGYWDSEDHTHKINTALIKKHGFKRFIFGMTGYEETKGVNNEKTVTG